MWSIRSRIPFETYIAAVLVPGWTMPLWCHIFTLTLVGVPRAWFEGLPEGKITNWDDLANKFTQHFSQQRRHIRDSSDILSVTLKDNETIEDFVTRFNKKGLNIGGVGEELMHASFHQNVRCDDLIHTLTCRDGMPKGWDAIMTVAKSYARTEKAWGMSWRTPTQEMILIGPIKARKSAPFSHG